MKQGRKPTRDQKEILSKKNLRWQEWEVVKSDREFFVVRHRGYGNTKVIWV